MTQGLKNILKLSALGLSMGVLVGCAAVGEEEDEMRQMVEDAQATAEEAMTVSHEARATAQDAQATAEAAEYQASVNQSDIEELNEKIDRMFERSMEK